MQRVPSAGRTAGSAGPQRRNTQLRWAMRGQHQLSIHLHRATAPPPVSFSIRAPKLFPSPLAGEGQGEGASASSCMTLQIGSDTNAVICHGLDLSNRLTTPLRVK